MVPASELSASLGWWPKRHRKLVTDATLWLSEVLSVVAGAAKTRRCMLVLTNIRVERSAWSSELSNLKDMCMVCQVGPDGTQWWLRTPDSPFQVVEVDPEARSPLSFCVTFGESKAKPPQERGNAVEAYSDVASCSLD